MRWALLPKIGSNTALFWHHLGFVRSQKNSKSVSFPKRGRRCTLWNVLSFPEHSFEYRLLPPLLRNASHLHKTCSPATQGDQSLWVNLVHAFPSLKVIIGGHMSLFTNSRWLPTVVSVWISFALFSLPICPRFWNHKYLLVVKASEENAKIL